MRKKPVAAKPGVDTVVREIPAPLIFTMPETQSTTSYVVASKLVEVYYRGNFVAAFPWWNQAIDYIRMLEQPIAVEKILAAIDAATDETIWSCYQLQTINLVEKVNYSGSTSMMAYGVRRDNLIAHVDTSSQLWERQLFLRRLAIQDQGRVWDIWKHSQYQM